MSDPVGLQRPPRGGRRRAAAEGARGPAQARRRSGGGARRSRGRARRRAISRELVPELEERTARARRGAALAMVPTRPGGREGRHPRSAPGRRRRRGGALGRRPLPDARALRRAARLQGRGARREPERRRRLQGSHVRDQGRRRVLGLQVGGRHASRAARPRDRVARTHPHVDRDRRRHAGGRGGRDRHRPERPEDRRLPLDRAGGAVRQHDGLRRADHARADGRHRRDAGREVAAPEQGQGACACCARGSTSRELELQRAELDATRRSQIGTGERAEKIRTYNFPENRLTDHRIKLTVHQLDRILQGELDEFTAALTAEDRRRALGE